MTIRTKHRRLQSWGQLLQKEVLRIWAETIKLKKKKGSGGHCESSIILRKGFISLKKKKKCYLQFWVVRRAPQRQAYNWLGIPMAPSVSFHLEVTNQSCSQGTVRGVPPTCSLCSKKTMLDQQLADKSLSAGRPRPSVRRNASTRSVVRVGPTLHWALVFQFVRGTQTR